MKLEELLRDRSKLLWIVWIAFWSSIVLIAIGFYYIIQDLLG
ncbi:MAG: hypothetical protein OEM29_01080 [Thermoplasmata archaeon]|nr:hypothetical protein [Thermoplasmata archaeon]